MDLHTCDLAHIFSGLDGVARQFGFDCYAYAVKTVDAAPHPVVSIRDSYPQAWRQRYLRQNYIAVDPTIHAVISAAAPALWSAELFATAPGMWRDIHAHGIEHGWSVPVGRNSIYAATLSLTRRVNPISCEESDRLNRDMVWIAELAHSSLLEFVDKRRSKAAHLGANCPELSAREIEVLRWTAAGKTNSEIARLLALRECTVNFHVRQVMTKLYANNKTHAVVQAVRLGLI